MPISVGLTTYIRKAKGSISVHNSTRLTPQMKGVIMTFPRLFIASLLAGVILLGGCSTTTENRPDGSSRTTTTWGVGPVATGAIVGGVVAGRSGAIGGAVAGAVLGSGNSAGAVKHHPGCQGGAQPYWLPNGQPGCQLQGQQPGGYWPTQQQRDCIMTPMGILRCDGAAVDYRLRQAEEQRQMWCRQNPGRCTPMLDDGSGAAPEVLTPPTAPVAPLAPEDL